MSISKQEAERCYPTQYWNGKNWPLKLLSLTTDDLQLAYQSGARPNPARSRSSPWLKHSQWCPPIPPKMATAI